MAVAIFDESIDIHMITVPVILIGLFAIATAIGIKVHLEKARNTVNNLMLKMDCTKTQIISNWKLIIPQSNDLEELRGK
jgi:hypothetical protein